MMATSAFALQIWMLSRGDRECKCGVNDEAGIVASIEHGGAVVSTANFTQQTGPGFKPGPGVFMCRAHMYPK